MTSRPILFSGEMVRAILDGKKTVTRRLVTVPRGARRALPYGPYWVDEDGELFAADEYGDYHEASLVLRPYGVPGDTLWVRETHAFRVYQHSATDDALRTLIEYRATPGDEYSCLVVPPPDWRPPASTQHWRPSIFMPQWASRITLRVTGHRVERLHCIDEDDARREGVESRADFAALWDKINGKRAPWADNPWVHRVEFEVVR